MNDFKKGNFANDEEKMSDFCNLTKEEFLASYSYLTEEEYENTKAIVNARTDYAKYRAKLIEFVIDGREVLNAKLQERSLVVDVVLVERFNEDINYKQSYISPVFIKEISADGYFSGSVALEDNIFYGEWYDYDLDNITTESLLRITDLFKSVF
jgi:hypothetical protein